MIDHLTTHCHQHLGAPFHVREYLGKSGLVTAYKSFVWPVCEYRSIIFMGASAVHLFKLDAVQNAADKMYMCQSTFPILSQGQCHWPAV